MSATNSVLAALVTLFVCSCGCEPERQGTGRQANQSPSQMNQCPSPMKDAIRAHERIENREVPGVSIVLNDALSKPVEVYFTDPGHARQRVDLLLHFHGAGYVPRRAGFESGRPFIVAVVNLGSGSAVYENEFRDEGTFPTLIERVRVCVSERAAAEIEISGVYLSSFSAEKEPGSHLKY